MNNEFDLIQAQYRFHNLNTSLRFCLEHINDASSRLHYNDNFMPERLQRIEIYSQKVEEFANAAQAQYDEIQDFHRN